MHGQHQIILLTASLAQLSSIAHFKRMRNGVATPICDIRTNISPTAHYPARATLSISKTELTIWAEP